MKPIARELMFCLHDQGDHYTVAWSNPVVNWDTMQWTDELPPSKTRWEKAKIKFKGGTAVLPILVYSIFRYIPESSLNLEISRRYKEGNPEALHD
ncbi:MAG: hypothetical protein KAJ19_10030 [Gammaproteobacteria bacterium]|nr:hypothetical protein [Gammaproteobacteria bacterium]